MAAAERLWELSLEAVRRLSELQLRLVLAESCTGGTLSGALMQVPGVSKVFCGSAVTYREDTKVNWLGVRPETLRLHSAVSAETTEEMARGVLWATPEADIGFAVTGHYGPEAPADLDGVVFGCLSRRGGGAVEVWRKWRWDLTSQSRTDRVNETVVMILSGLVEEFAGRCETN